MKQFFKRFLKKNKWGIFFFSFWRLISFAQDLVWPYAFSKIVNIMSEMPQQWRQAIFWTVLITINAATSDFIRLHSKLGLEKIASKLKINLATFFCENTKIKRNKKTGEAVQAIKNASEEIQNLVLYYKENILQLPICFVIIPLILFKANLDYLSLLIIYIIIYLAIDIICTKIYNRKMKKYYETSEIFWGTTYRKTPDVWREREDGDTFVQKIEKQGDGHYQADSLAMQVNTRRWTLLQVLSSITIGAVIFFVLHRIIYQGTHVGDLILVTGYFQKTQETLNIITSSLTQIVQTRLSLIQLNKAVKIK